MTSISAEYDYFKEFQDFHIGFTYDGAFYYNNTPEEEEKSYYKKISELSDKLQLEIEMNLLCFSDSKSKSKKYIERVIEKLLVVRDDLDLFEYEAHELIVMVPKEVSFTEKLWHHHLDKLEIILSYCRNQLLQFELSNKNLNTEESDVKDKILWVDVIPLRKLYNLLITTSLGEYPFIDRNTMLLKEFEKHFIATTESPSSKINWLREQYLLTHLFDLLSKKKLLHQSFRAKSGILLSEHFTIKGYDTSSKKLTSTKETFAKKTGTSEKKQQSINYLERMIDEMTKKPKRSFSSKGNGFDDKVNHHSANSRT